MKLVRMWREWLEESRSAFVGLVALAMVVGIALGSTLA